MIQTVWVCIKRDRGDGINLVGLYPTLERAMVELSTVEEPEWKAKAVKHLETGVPQDIRGVISMHDWKWSKEHLALFVDVRTDNRDVRYWLKEESIHDGGH